MKRLTAAFAIGLTLAPLLYAEGAFAQRKGQAETPEQAAAEAQRKEERQRRQQEQQARAQAQSQAQAQQQQQALQRQQAQAQQQEQNRLRQERQQAQAARAQQQQDSQTQNQAQQQQNEQRRQAQEARRLQQQQQAQSQAQQQQQNEQRRQAQEARRLQQQQQGQSQQQQQQLNEQRRQAQEARAQRRATTDAPRKPGAVRADRPAKPTARQGGAERVARPARRDRTTVGAAKPSRPRAGLSTRPNRQPAADQNRAARRFDAARSRQLRQEARQRRQTQQARRSFRLGGRTRVVVRAPRYAYPAGQRYRAWRRGQRFPVALLLASWFLNDLSYYGLGPAPAGYRWVRYGPDAVLVNTSTYEVYDTDYGVFDDGEVPYGQDQADLPPVDPDLPEDFLTGDLQLARDDQDNGAACEAFYGDADWQADIDDAWRDEDWNGVAAQVIDGGCESDLGYYLLGLSAEGLVLPQAAAAYYQRALDLYDSQSQDDCDAFSEDVCRGLNVGDEAAAGLERIYGAGR